MTEELKPCNFCGTKPEHHIEGKYHFVRCAKCWNAAGDHPTKKKAAVEWNKKVS